MEGVEVASSSVVRWEAGAQVEAMWGRQVGMGTGGGSKGSMKVREGSKEGGIKTAGVVCHGGAVKEGAEGMICMCEVAKARTGCQRRRGGTLPCALTPAAAKCCMLPVQCCSRCMI